MQPGLVPSVARRSSDLGGKKSDEKYSMLELTRMPALHPQ